MAVLYVASDSSGAGKTAFCATLAKFLSDKGKKVGLFKLEGSVDDGRGADVEAYQKLLGKDSVAVKSGKLGSTGKRDAATQAVGKMASELDAVLVEGLSGLDDKASGEFANAVNARTIVVTGYRPDLTAKDLSPAKDLFGKGLLGVVINGWTRYAGTRMRQSLLPSLESEGLHVLGAVPEDRRLLGLSVNQLADHLHGRYVGRMEEEMGNYLVEHFLIGGWILDWGVNYFSTRDHKAVIARGDRPDIQMSALATHTSCLVATGGKEPLEYVLYEAEEEEVPIIVVQTDTLSTASALEAIMEGANFDHPLKLGRLQELMQANVDLQWILSELGVSA